MAKHVLLIVVDALSSRVIRPAVEEGRLPNFRRLIEAGHANWECLSIFPSITPAATSSICTGKYPSGHHVMGAHYYDREEDRVFYFGDDFWVVLDRGFKDFFTDFLRVLNHECLEAPTLFEELEAQGRSCASVNYLIYQGTHPYRVDVPWLLRLFPGVPSHAEVKGPQTLTLGDFVASMAKDEANEDFDAPGGVFRRFGFSDETTGEHLLQLAERGLPDFTLAYFPDNDFDSHAEGPQQAVKTVTKVDHLLGNLFERGGGFDSFLENTAIIITGDHSQSAVNSRDDDLAINLDDVLQDFQTTPAGEPWRDGNELMICPNLRVAQVYLREELLSKAAEIANRILSEDRVDQVILKQGRPGAPDPHYVVRTADRGRLEFWPAASGDEDKARRVSDEFGNTWHVTGDLAAVDARVAEDESNHQLEYGDYPNALERIAESFDGRYAGDLWVTARLGHEFTLPRTSGHPDGGSHGSLHREDSVSPLIIAGSGAMQTANELSLVERPVRSVDVAPLCRRLLGVPV